MEAYTGFAMVYDEFMDNAPYLKWFKQTKQCLEQEGIYNGIVVDLGCGTGVLTEIFAKSGYDMIGIDISEDMLDIAIQKKDRSGLEILYLCQDMRKFELYGTCKAIICRCDSINYLRSWEELVEVFRLVNNYLDPKGLFLFDCNTIYKYEKVLAYNTFAENRENASFIWNNEYNTKTKCNQYDLTLYIKDEEEDIFYRFEETHIQRAFSLEEIKLAAKEVGLRWGYVRDADTDKDIAANTERYLIGLYEYGKNID